jgi:opacity protein-like surface antigen
MRITPIAAILLAAVFVTTSASAQQPRASLQGFGGLGVNSPNTVSPTFGGAVVGELTPNVHLVGEAGRIGDVLPSQTQTLIGLSPVGFSVSAFYASGGVRLSSGSSAVRPYAEASAGIARLTPHISGLQGLESTLANVGLSFLNRTAPMAGVGAGITLQGGPLFADIGYRHRRVLSDTWVDALALGGSLSTNEVRVGVGVRF